MEFLAENSWCPECDDGLKSGHFACSVPSAKLLAREATGEIERVMMREFGLYFGSLWRWRRVAGESTEEQRAIEAEPCGCPACDEGVKPGHYACRKPSREMLIRQAMGEVQRVLIRRRVGSQYGIYWQWIERQDPGYGAFDVFYPFGRIEGWPFSQQRGGVK